MNLRKIHIALLGALLATAVPVAAHHGTAVSYEQGSWITVKGTVTEFRWRNPHSALFLDITDDKGEMVNYAIELPSPVLMSRSNGWTRATFKVGDTVEFRVHPSRTGAPVGECLTDCLVYVNGELLPARLPTGGTRQEGAPAEQPAQTPAGQQ
jgi:hypothetical protein